MSDIAIFFSLYFIFSFSFFFIIFLFFDFYKYYIFMCINISQPNKRKSEEKKNIFYIYYFSETLVFEYWIYSRDDEQFLLVKCVYYSFFVETNIKKKKKLLFNLSLWRRATWSSQQHAVTLSMAFIYYKTYYSFYFFLYLLLFIYLFFFLTTFSSVLVALMSSWFMVNCKYK